MATRQASKSEKQTIVYPIDWLEERSAWSAAPYSLPQGTGRQRLVPDARLVTLTAFLVQATTGVISQC
jgi:hypothetical protein